MQKRFNKRYCYSYRLFKFIFWHLSQVHCVFTFMFSFNVKPKIYLLLKIMKKLIFTKMAPLLAFLDVYLCIYRKNRVSALSTFEEKQNEQAILFLIPTVHVSESFFMFINIVKLFEKSLYMLYRINYNKSVANQTTSWRVIFIQLVYSSSTMGIYNNVCKRTCLIFFFTLFFFTIYRGFL